MLVADKAEIVDARDVQTVPLHTPLELFGEKVWDSHEPLLPVRNRTIRVLKLLDARLDNHNQEHPHAKAGPQSQLSSSSF